MLLLLDGGVMQSSAVQCSPVQSACMLACGLFASTHMSPTPGHTIAEALRAPALPGRAAPAPGPRRQDFHGATHLQFYRAHALTLDRSSTWKCTISNRWRSEGFRTSFNLSFGRNKPAEERTTTKQGFKTKTEGI